MTRRDTTPGTGLGALVLPALGRGGYAPRPQVSIGQRFGGGRHVVDGGAEDESGHRFLVSLKWQQVSGTAEQKVPFEAISLADAVIAGGGFYTKAYLVLGGRGWKLRDFFIEGGLKQYLRHADLVTILSLEDFVAKANKGLL